MPNTLIYLLNVPLQNDYQHTFWFGSKNEQIAYFYQNCLVKEISEYSYIRKDKIIRVAAQMDSILNCNYVAFRNSDYSSKWFFAFINKMEYVNDNLTALHIETDVIQTWMFDYEVKKSFVEREHVSDDTIGKHTIPEGLQLGEYVSNKKQKVANLQPSNYIVMGSSVRRKDYDAWVSDFETKIGGIYNGIYSGVRYYKFLRSSSNSEEQTITKVLQDIADDGKIDAVSSLFLAPEFLITSADGSSEIDQSTTHKYFDVMFSKDNKLNGYTPKNNKLLTDPYNYLLVSNGTGGSAIYQFEHFTTYNECNFKVIGSLTPGCSIRMVPIDYKGVNFNNLEGINLGKYPQCNWATDQYTNWLTQNGVSVATSIISAGASIGFGLALGGPVGAATGAVSGVAGVFNSMNEVIQASRIPPQTSGNTNCGDVTTSAGENTFTLYHMTIKKEYAEIIDQYFNVYGYKVNMVKVPNENHRTNYWYTKTIDANIIGAIPKEDMNKIIQSYNSGITFWKNPSNFRDYSVDNSIK